MADKYPFYTPYQYAGNKPINSIDIDGLEGSGNTGQDGNKPTEGPMSQITDNGSSEHACGAIDANKNYTVVGGGGKDGYDTLHSIANRFNTTVAAISNLNSIKDIDNIKAGDVIQIPTPSQTSEYDKKVTLVDTIVKTEQVRQVKEQNKQAKTQEDFSKMLKEQFGIQPNIFIKALAETTKLAKSMLNSLPNSADPSSTYTISISLDLMKSIETPNSSKVSIDMATAVVSFNSKGEAKFAVGSSMEYSLWDKIPIAEYGASFAFDLTFDENDQIKTFSGAYIETTKRLLLLKSTTKTSLTDGSQTSEAFVAMKGKLSFGRLTADLELETKGFSGKETLDNAARGFGMSNRANTVAMLNHYSRKASFKY
ncbi:MAG: LysM peptidoglycan-binding domain-containing protein [Bacteroidota bacterium]